MAVSRWGAQTNFLAQLPPAAQPQPSARGSNTPPSEVKTDSDCNLFEDENPTSTKSTYTRGSDTVETELEGSPTVFETPPSATPEAHIDAMKRLVAPASKEFVHHGKVVAYTPTEHLGRGAFGVVKKCQLTDLAMPTEAAIKRPSFKKFGKSTARSAASLRNEIKILRSLAAHPNIVRLFDDFEYLSRHGTAKPAMVIELGQCSLFRIIRSAKMPPKTLQKLLLDTLSAGTHLAAHGILHRDYKPENILLGYDGHFKLCDFGVAAVSVERDETLGLKTVSRTPVGTAHYFSPERSLSSSAESSLFTVSEKSDIFSVGALMYECIVGERLNSGENTIVAMSISIPEMYADRNIEACKTLDKHLGATNPLTSLIKQMIHPDPKIRPTFSEGLKQAATLDVAYFSA